MFPYFCIMRIASNAYKSVMNFALQELSDLYPADEIKSIVYYLFEEYLKLSKTDYILNPNKRMSESELLKFNFTIKDLKKGKPIQHILGYGYFNDLKFLVNKETLIPRPETEELVEMIIQNEKEKEPLKVLDIGTGTGCIPISLALSMPQHHYSAIDFKDEIIHLAKQNAKLHQAQISFQILDILEASSKDLDSYDIIISNPPYVLESEKQIMHSNVVDYEPSSALYVNDEEALIFYEKIAKLAIKNLNSGGRLYFEINETKGKEVAELLESLGFEQIKAHKDLHSKYRFVTGQLPL